MVLRDIGTFQETTSKLSNVPKDEINAEGITSSSTLNKGEKCSIPKRYIFTLMNFMACFIFTCQYANIGISIVAMVNLTAFSTNKSRSEECPAPAEIEQAGHKVGDILWSPQVVGLVLGAASLGATIAKIPGGRLAERFECKTLMGIFLTMSSLLTMLTPTVARWGSYSTMILRFFTGLMFGPILPVVLLMLGQWIPKTEKNLHSSLIFGGIAVGNFLTPLVYSSLCNSDFLGGWPLVFYVSGLLGLLWGCLWFVLIYETPSEHPTISDNELKFIMENVSHKKKNKCLAIPWTKMLTSLPFWAFLSGYISGGWCFGFFLTVHPLYLGSMLHLPIAKNGLHSSLPHLFRVVFLWLGAFCTHWILKKKILNSNFVAKAWMIMNSFLTVFSFLGVTLVGCDETLATTFFVFSLLLHAISSAEVRTTCSNMVPALAGTVAGMADTLGASSTFIIPAIVGGLLQQEQTMSQWNKVFYINMAVIGVTSLIFVLFGTTEAQPWAIQPNDEEEDSAKDSTKP